MEDTPRSQSRGREAITSTGRGGAGNIRSLSRDALKGVHGEHEDDASNTRGREINISNKAMSSGRGGAGNIRSQSATRSPSAGPDSGEREIIRQHIAENDTIPHSSGRGGVGNITGTRSRSRGPSAAISSNTLPPLHSSGRGGAGNITREGLDHSKLAKIEAEEILKHAHHLEEPHLHSTGRGGRANITDLPIPPDTREAHHSETASNMHSSGRGGAGNIHYNHPPGVETDEEHGERGREIHGSKNVLQHVWEKVRAASSSRSRAEAHSQATTDSVVSGDGQTCRMVSRADLTKAAAAQT